MLVALSCFLPVQGAGGGAGHAAGKEEEEFFNHCKEGWGLGGGNERGWSDNKNAPGLVVRSSVPVQAPGVMEFDSKNPSASGRPRDPILS